MKLTLTIRGENKQFEHSMSVRRLFSIVVIVSMFVLVSSRSTQSVNENLARVNVSKQIVAQTQQQLNALSDRSSSQIAVLNRDIAQANVQIKTIESRLNIIAQAVGIKHSDLAVIKEEVKPPLHANPLQSEIAQLQQSLATHETQLSMLESLLRGHHIDNQTQLSGRPIKRGWLSSYYGLREDPFSGEAAEHTGLDFAGSIGDDVIATGAGIVSWAGDRYGYGQMVEIDHIDGLKTRYAHNQAVYVAVGDVVTKGQVIAQMGSTGRSTGAHVHYEVLKSGHHVNPLPFVDNH
ncbi:peptidoglycan DD-metalloendopeptidase family protein [Alteromonas ponticola]|uniref:Peptidoglycan DD-metalloendopeptidase family protein n=1 Tax=Alteromonas aquimaris TaxID=2998417 RepID=A0ABT3P2U1_9ALTE|nr:M23 family metallopeptidase [Alteromonas aquimaris]MCW8107073.1 peptidoglycan DD-metalloendopeptidase family protein [Alteromonas aquimaris]